MELTEKTISCRRIHEGRIINVREDEVLLPDGKTAKREIVEHRGAVFIIPILNDQSVVTVRQFRQPAQQALLELPAGGLNAGEDPEHCARRELIEECSLQAGSMEPIFSCFLAPGYSSELIHGFIARDLVKVEAQPEDDENLQVEHHSLQDLLTMIDDGRILDAKTIAGVLALYRWRQRD